MLRIILSASFCFNVFDNIISNWVRDCDSVMIPIFSLSLVTSRRPRWAAISPNDIRVSDILFEIRMTQPDQYLTTGNWFFVFSLVQELNYTLWCSHSHRSIISRMGKRDIFFHFLVVLTRSVFTTENIFLSIRNHLIFCRVVGKPQVILNLLFYMNSLPLPTQVLSRDYLPILHN